MSTSRREFLSHIGKLSLVSIPWLHLPDALGLASGDDPGSEKVNPYLHSIFTPVDRESDLLSDLEVQGEIPQEISGAYFRNGPNPRFATKPHHWFDGDAMIHRLGIENGRASYLSRFVKTASWKHETKKGRRHFPGLLEPKNFQHVLSLLNDKISFGNFLKDTSNTDLIYYKGKIVSLWWLSGTPYALNPLTLETEGATNLGEYTGNACAHARVDPRTGHLFFLDFSKAFGWVKVFSVHPKGKVEWVQNFELPGPRIFHDLLFTQNYVILMDFPVGFKVGNSFNCELEMDPSQPARILLIPRNGSGKVREWTTKACYVLHGVNAHEEADSVVLTVCKYVRDPFLAVSKDRRLDIPYVGPLRVETQLFKWVLPQDSNSIRETLIDDTNTEFPGINPRYLGIKSRFSYQPRVTAGKYKTMRFDALLKKDWEDGKGTRLLCLKEGESCEEPIFISRKKAQREDDGWVGTWVQNTQTKSSCFRLYEAAELDQVAEIRLPVRVPAGFHGKWVPNYRRCT